MASNSIAVEAIQRGLEAAGAGAIPSNGSLVAATYQILGEGSVNFLDDVRMPQYARGIAGGIVEDTYIGGTGTELTLNDAELTYEELVWDMNAAIKAVVGAASNFPFTLPTTDGNNIRAYTWEYKTAAQEYEFGYGMFTDYSVHADADVDGGVCYRNAKITGRKSAASTVTSSLGLVANRQVLNIRGATVSLDAVGTAAGTASATANFLKGFSWDLKTGWMGEQFASGRSTLDFSDGFFHNYEITGTLSCLMSSDSVTRIANMRAGTPEILQVKFNGTSSRLAKFNIPLAWTGITGIGNVRKDGLRLVTLNYKGGYSNTSVAQGPSVDVTLSVSTTVT